MNSSALVYVSAFSSLAENKGAYCISRLFGDWGGGPLMAPEDVLCVSKKLLYFLSFRVKVLNINRFFSQPQRMRIGNTEGVMPKKITTCY